MRKQILAIIVAALAAGCGGGSPTTPSAPPATAAAVKAIRVTASEPIEVGKKSRLQATALYADGAEGAITGQVVWASLTPGVVTVDAEGVAVGVKYGEASIQASFGAQAGKLNTLVLGRPVEVTVYVDSFDCVADCDDTLNGKGDFVYRVKLDTYGSGPQSQTYETAGYPSSSGELKLGPGEQHSINKFQTFNLRDQPIDEITVSLHAVEWDTFSKKDDRLPETGAAEGFQWTEASLWGSAPGKHTLTLGSGGCVVRLVYDLSFRYSN